jgi:threonine dehydrogenase-like Zn-dependent dehydrogenase
MTGFMRAGLLEASEEFVVKEIPVPEPGVDEVLIRVHACGVCMSEVSKWKLGPYDSTRPDYPQVLNVLNWDFSKKRRNKRRYPAFWGHEMSGEIVELGKGVSHLKPGMRVTGFGSRGFAEYCLLPAHYTLPLDDEIHYSHAIGEPIGCAYNSTQRAGVKSGDSVVLVGCGFMGLLTLQMVRLANPRIIVALDIRDDALAVARQTGADAVINIAQEDVIRRLEEILGPQGADVSIEVVGKQESLDLASRVLAVRGRLVIVGFHQGGPRTVDMEYWNWKGLDIVNAQERDPQIYFDGLSSGMRLLEDNKLRMEPLITHLFPLERLDDAFHQAVVKPEGFIKAVITP